MRNILLLLVLNFSFLAVFSQSSVKAKSIVSEGIQLHDKGDYNGAISKYDEAIAVDENCALAYAEKTLTLLSLGKNEECIELGKKTIEKFPDDEALQIVYIDVGTAYDNIGKSSQALNAYEEGIKKFPDSYMLHFNKGITHSFINEYDESRQCFFKSISLNPKHPGSCNALGRVEYIEGNDIAALLVLSHFIILEPTGYRAEKNFPIIEKLISGGSSVSSKGKKITINISDIEVTDSNYIIKENDFNDIKGVFALTGALSISNALSKTNKKLNAADEFAIKFDLLLSLMEEKQEEHYGFYWERYVPYFLELKEIQHTQTLGYLIYAAAGKKFATKWIKKNYGKVTDLIRWSKMYKWE